MEKVKFILLIFVGVIFIAGCKVTSQNEKLIIGSWKNGRINSFIVNEKHAADSNFYASNQLRLGAEGQNKNKLEQESLKEFKSGFKSDNSSRPVDFMALIKTGMDINPDKSTTIYTPTGNYGGKWKMNGKGDKLTITDTVTKKKILLNIAKVDSVRLQVFERIPTGDLYMTFKK